MISNSGFMALPNLVLSQILSKSDFRTIQTIRKVSKSLRGFVDDVKPNSGLLEVTVTMCDSENLKICYKTADGEYKVQYQSTDDGCLMIHGKKEWIFNNVKPSTIAFGDLEQILSKQKSILKTFLIRKSSFEILNILKTRILESRRPKLKVQEFVIETCNQNDVMEILPFLDPESLEEFRIFSSESEVLEIDEISSSAHWTRIKEITIEGCYISTSDLKHFKNSNFKKVSVDLKTINTEDVMELKNIFLASESLQKFTLFYSEFSDLKGLLDILGPPKEHRSFRTSWFFRFPESSDSLKLEHLNFEQPKFILSRV